MKILLKIFIVIQVFILQQTYGQTIVINEFVHRPLIADGPTGGLNTGEWIELYNTTSSPIDIGCYTILCKLFAVNIPVGTIIQPFDYYTLGGSSSGVPLDFNWTTQPEVFTLNNSVGILGNGGDYVTLWDNTQAMIDGIVYPNPTLPTATPSLLPLSETFSASCGIISINSLSISMFASNNLLPSSTAAGHSWARKCDGSADWEDRTIPLVTPHATNGTPPIINFVASDSTLCIGDCINFTDLTTPSTGITSWNWTFVGANTATSSLQNPTGICYSSSFDWDVTLEVVNSCGTYTLTKPGYISVPILQTPIITQNTVSADCSSISVNLSTFDIYSSYQWFKNGITIPGSNNDTIVITSPGVYQVSVVDQGCTLSSQQVTINDMGIPNFNLNLSGPPSFCTGDSLVMSFTGSYSFQWLLNGSPIAGATSNSFTAFTSGAYSLIAVNGICIDTSAVVNVFVSPPFTSSITPSFTTICGGQSQQFAASPSTGTFSYQWLFNGVVVPSVTSNVFTGSTSGSYSVIVSDAIGCSSSSTATLIVSSFSIPTISSSVPSLSLCTNPAITLSVPNVYANYQWTESSTAIAGATSSTLSVTTPGSYYVVVTDVNGCTAISDTVSVTNGINAALTVSVNGPTQLCPGASVTMNASVIPNVAYQWFENAAPIAGATANSLTESNAGTYSVLVTDANGCTLVSNSITVVNLTQPTVTISLSGADSICVGRNVVISANPFNGTAYQWLNGGTIDNSSNSFSLVVSTAGSYSVIMTDANGCKDTSNVIPIETYQAFDITFLSSTGLFTICPGGSLALSVNPTTAITYSWILNGSAVGGNNFTINVNQTGEYFVTVKDANGCTDSDSVNITPSTPPLPIVLPTNDVKICSGTPVTLSTSTYTSYQWIANGVPMVDSTFQYLVVSQPGSYSVAVIDANGCTGISPPKVITAAVSPQPLIVALSDVVCEGLPRTIQVTGSFSINEWFNNDTGTETVVTNAGSYWVDVTDSNGCKGSDTAFVFFKPLPQILVQPTIELPCGKPDSIQLVTNGTIQWYPSSGLSDSTSASPQVTTKVPQLYTAIVTLDGCVDSATVDVTLAVCDSMFVPEAFTPNGDGNNDVFKAIGQSVKTFRFEIFNRWGQLIFSTTDINEGWDGTYKGKKCEAGIYVWQIEAFDYFDIRVLSRSRAGKVALIR